MDSSIEHELSEVLGGLLFEHMLKYEDFSATEKYGMEKALALLRTALEKAVVSFDQALFEEKDPRFVSKGFERREILTLAGPVSFKRRRYRSDLGSVYLFDEALALPDYQKVTPQVTHFASAFALDQSYERAADALCLYCGENISRQAVGRALKRSAEALKERKVDTHKRRVPALDVEADGVYVCRQRRAKEKAADRARGIKRKRVSTEVSVMVSYEGKKRINGQTKTRIRPTYFATTNPAPNAWEEFGAMLDKCYELDALFTTNLATDGDSKYIRGSKALAGKVSLGYDLHHILSAIAPAYGRDIAKEVYQVMTKLSFEQGRATLADYCDYFTTTTQDTKYQETLDFIDKHAHSIKTALSYNLGTIESTNAHLVGARCKIYGGGWGSGLDAMVRLRAARANGQALPIPTRKSCISLPALTKARQEKACEIRLAELSTKAKQIRHQAQGTVNHPLYYNQVPIAHQKANEANYSWLHKLNLN